MNDELAMLERRLAVLIEYMQTLRAANEALRRELGATQEQNRVLAQRMQAATTRLDALLARLPTE
jgi:hypothetical protein